MNRNRRIQLPGACAFLAATVLAGQGAFLVENGEPRAKIVVAEAPPRLVDLAVRELREYIQKISGAELPVGTSPDGAFPVSIFIGHSAHTEALGVSDEGLSFGAFRMVSGPDHLVLLGHDADFEPVEPWARNHGDRERAQAEWEDLSGFQSRNPAGSLHRAFNRSWGLWANDEGGSLQAVYQFLRDLGVRWYMPGELGEVVPEMTSIPLPDVDRRVVPDVRFRDLRLGNVSSYSNWEDLVWYWRLGLNSESLGGAHGMRGIMHNREWRETRPDFYALYGGERLTHTSHACYSNPYLLEKVIQYTRFVFDHYGRIAVNIMPEDGYRHCECERCTGRSPSETVWEFVNAAAKAVFETHPDRLIVGGAYTAYQAPPDTIDRFSPNLAVRISWTRPGLDDPERWAEFADFVERWTDKLAPNRILRNANVQWSANPRFPLFFPKSIAWELLQLRDHMIGENSSIPRTRHDRWQNAGVSHLNTYVLSRYFWDASQALDPLLAEYYTLFYGPAAAQMQQAFTIAEQRYSRMGHPNRGNDLNDSIRLAERVQAAREVAGDSVYGRRIDKVLDGIMPIEQLEAELQKIEEAARQRFDNPLAVAADTRRAQEPNPYRLVDLVTGETPEVETVFTVQWEGNALVFDVRCEEPNMDDMPITANVWGGDSVAILLETPFHSYYHIEVNADGDRFDADWELGRVRGWDNWSSEAEVKTEKGAHDWRVRVRIPVVPVEEGQDDPLHFVVGPAPAADAPWFFNVGRTRGGIRQGQERERYLFAPTGGGNYHQPGKFGRLIIE